jgi:pilus assembly protein CpaC
VVEINKSDSSQLGVKWGGLRLTPTGDAIFSANHMTFAEPSPGQIQGFMPFDRLAADLELLVKNGKAKILSNPSLTAASGGKASFLVGGEVPIPMAQAQGQVTVDWKEYGVKLDIAPTVMDNGKISLKLSPEVSTLDYNNGVRINNFSIPALSSRKTDTQIVLQDGQSLLIGGLLQNQDVKHIEKLPLLGDIPVLGELFKSSGFQTDQTELTIMVTPRLVKPKEASK